MIKLYDVSCTNPYTVQAALHQLFFSVQKSAELIGDHKKKVVRKNKPRGKATG
jgi:hypothetical protein